MLAGEYAVLHGRPSLVMAVDRHAVVRALAADETARPTPPEVAATSRSLAAAVPIDPPPPPPPKRPAPHSPPTVPSPPR